jgi:hypothetical protein
MLDNLDFVYKALSWTMPNQIKAPTAKLPQVLPTKKKSVVATVHLVHQ